MDAGIRTKRWFLRHFVHVAERYQPSKNEVVVPGTGLEPVWSCLRGIFVLATAFTAESCDSFGVWTFSLPCSAHRVICES
jgi:hypothetical protein